MNEVNLICGILPLETPEPGLRCPNEWSGDTLVFQQEVGDKFGLLLLLKLLVCFRKVAIGIVAFMGPCFVELGDDFKPRAGVP